MFFRKLGLYIFLLFLIGVGTCVSETITRPTIEKYVVWIIWLQAHIHKIDPGINSQYTKTGKKNDY